jgi:putative aldouronate transport system permease protein
MKRRKTTGDIVFNIILYSVLILMVVVTIYPFLNSLAISLNDADDTTRGGITVYPRIFSLRNYN